MRKEETGKSRRLRRLLTRLRRNNAGTALVETAFVLPVIALASIGTLEVGMTMLSTTMLEGAISEASRSGMTGFIAENQTREEYINEVLKEKTFGMINLDNLAISQKVYDGFSDVGLSEPYTDVDGDGAYTSGVDSYTDMNCNNGWDEEIGTEGLGGPGDVVLYEVTYDANFMTGFFSRMIGDEDGKIRLTASTVIQNEPYGTPDPNCTAEVKT